MFYDRIDSMGISDIVKVVEFDFTDSKVFDHMPKAGSVDVITMSYSFSMIPNQAAAMQNAAKLLKKGEGIVAVADFFQKGNYDDCLPFFSRNLRVVEAYFQKQYFALDHIHLLGEKQLDMGGDSDLETIWDNRFRGAVPFMPFLQPYHGVYIQKKK
jgi:ubiquinone/menaquinone biosynthesis C-methylase UbiE